MKRMWFSRDLNVVWNYRVLPWTSNDEHGRRTLVLPLAVGSLVVALWRCHCEACEVGRLS